MQLIVNIDKEVYRAIKSPLDSGGYYDSKCFDAIWNGVPLEQDNEKYKEFAEWVVEEIFSDDWEYNKDSFAEIACRKLEKMGMVRKTETDWVFEK